MLGSAALAQTVMRTGATTAALVANFALTGTAMRAADYSAIGGNAVTIPAGVASVVVPAVVINTRAQSSRHGPRVAQDSAATPAPE